ncbi:MULTISPECIES: hypothetical protein [unclassified Neptuniibacter]|uniref:hypothetical protein n=1 Tax=unclassified Neptuniibacter TaxID=2630693 RepID=UPI000C4D0CD9|nr:MULTISPECIES: hypothetical protein [unclassified Neptuniibacter]MAY40812.1 hypothetical protein [Oceanospirillaceae bacterium]|tara:strand:- start:8175 stop:8504 length:330 start_codon:yes stop_codon:yes gene_type:complete
MFKLVKDFDSYEFIYYWVDQNNSKVSSNLATVELAEEWLIHYHFSEYPGKERRRSFYDRRYSANKVKLQGTQIFFSKRKPPLKGRRMTDRVIEVDMDLSKEKINSLIAL